VEADKIVTLAQITNAIKGIRFYGDGEAILQVHDALIGIANELVLKKPLEVANRISEVLEELVFDESIIELACRIGWAFELGRNYLRNRRFYDGDPVKGEWVNGPGEVL
jgi:hypothetical protein